MSIAAAAALPALFPGWAHMFIEAGRARGWPRATRAQFDAMCGPQGAFLIGSPGMVKARIMAADRALGGLSRITFQISSAMPETAAMQRSIALPGTTVAPAVRGAQA